MLDDFEPSVRKAVMRILAAIYETGMIDTVDLGIVVQLFGVSIDPSPNNIISFDNEEWMDAYIDFTADYDDSELIHLDDDDPLAKMLKEKIMENIPDFEEASQSDELEAAKIKAINRLH